MDSITVAEAGRPLTFTFVALSSEPLERREIEGLTAFTGPGGCDAVEAAIRAATDGRHRGQRALGGANVIDAPPGPYLWRFSYRGTTVEVTIRPGHVREEFVRLGARPARSAAEEARLTELKAVMAARLVPLPAGEVYQVAVVAPELT